MGAFVEAILLAAAAAAAFNLSCSGTLETQDFYRGKASEPYTNTYRIDLGAGKYCESDCKVIHVIHEVQPAYIMLEPPDDTDTVTKKRFYRSTINRETGRQETLLTSGRGADVLIMKWSGQCTRQEFTGFPKLETQF